MLMRKEPSSAGTLFFRIAALFIVGVQASGCSSGTSAGSGSGTLVAPSIATQPSNESVPMGLPATFSVAAFGNPLNYQWSEDGTPIPGATSDVYTTPATTTSDNNEAFTVTVSNSLGTVTSSAATLAVTARAPQAGDLRFQQVDAASTVNGYGSGGEFTNFIGYGADALNPGIGAPLSIGPGCPATGSDEFACQWLASEYGLPVGVTGLSVNYQGFSFDNLSSLSSWAEPTYRHVHECPPAGCRSLLSLPSL